VATRRHDIAANPGAYSWAGGFGTNFVTDPAEGLTAILMTQRMMQSADDTTPARTLFTLAYAAIDDRGEDR
jgi:CubicO group peptidase (beta-lactamase class C family)